MTIFLLTFAGLPATTLVLGFLAAAAVTTVLYILRLRRRRVGVAFLELWERSLIERKASQLRSRLQRILSLLLSLVIVGALVLALGDPRSEDEEEEGRSIAVLLDVSASMGEPSEQGTRLDAARQRVKKWLPTLGPGDEMLLIELGARPRPLAPATGDAELLREALAEAEVLDVSADLEAGLRLAKDALRGREHPEIILVSDGALPPIRTQDFSDLPPVFFEAVAQKRPKQGQNVGITSFSARRYPLSGDRFEVLVELTNDGDAPAEVELALFEATDKGERGAQLDLERLTLPPEGAVAESYSNLDQAQTGLIAELRRVDLVPDPFSRDNIARTLLAERIGAKVLVVGKPDNFLDAALLLEESLEVRRVSAEDYPPSGKYDVTIFNGVFPPRASSTGAAFYLGAPAEKGEYPVEIGEELTLFGFDTWKEDSTVFRLVDPYNVQVLKGRALVPQKSDVVYGASNSGPLLVRGKRAEGEFLALGFSPRESDFVLRTAWPLFVLNVIDELFPRGRTDAVLGLRTGTLWRPPVPTSQTTVKVRGPLAAGKGAERAALPESTVPIDEGRAVFFGQRAGFYEAVSKDGVVRFAGSILSGKEGALPPTDAYLWGDKALPKVPEMKPRAHRKPWFWLLVGVLALSFSEWWFYHRRWTV